MLPNIRNVIAEQISNTDNFYLYDENRIKERINDLHENFPQIKFLYSIKCNNNKNVMKSVFNQGLGADAASLQEVLMASECNLTKNDIYYSAPGKTLKDVTLSIDKSIIIADSLNEIILIDKVAQKRAEIIEIGIRLNPNFTFYSEEGQPSKFGIDEDDAIEFIKGGQCKNIKVSGIHVHLRSQELNPLILKGYYERMIDLAKRFITLCGGLKFINMGSGMGIQYSEANRPLNMKDLSLSVKNKLSEFVSAYPETSLIIEVGRYVVGECGMYVTTVLDRKTSRGKTYVILKNTLNGFIRPSLERLVVHYSNDDRPAGCEPLFSCKNAFRFLTLKDDVGLKEKVTLVGNLCTSSDVVADDIELPPLAIGDVVIMTNAGAYGAVLSPMQFASQEKPEELFLLVDGSILKS